MDIPGFVGDGNSNQHGVGRNTSWKLFKRVRGIRAMGNPSPKGVNQLV